jgi:hypothetical protein
MPPHLLQAVIRCDLSEPDDSLPYKDRSSCVVRICIKAISASMVCILNPPPLQCGHMQPGHVCGVLPADQAA